MRTAAGAGFSAWPLFAEAGGELGRGEFAVAVFVLGFDQSLEESPLFVRHFLFGQLAVAVGVELLKHRRMFGSGRRGLVRGLGEIARRRGDGQGGGPGGSSQEVGLRHVISSPNSVGGRFVEAAQHRTTDHSASRHRLQDETSSGPQSFAFSRPE
ncbi:MAG: hypothetical protein QM775_14565 [Pirellulales bacterium]